jgi:hypothetical protein
MKQWLQYISAVVLGLVLLAPVVSVAQAPSAQPLVTIRFNQPRVYFDQQLYSAIAKAVAIKPDVTFDVVSFAPSTGNAQTDAQWQAVAGHNTRAVIAVMNNIGVPMDRITVTGQSQSGLRFDETRVFVH